MKLFGFLACAIGALLAEEMVVDLQDFGKVVYCFEDGLCEKIVRLSPSGEVKYEHVYHYDQDKRFASESLIGGLGEITYSGNPEEGSLVAKTPFGEERWSKENRCAFKEANVEKVYDAEGFLIQKESKSFFYECGKLVQVLRDQHRVFLAYDEEGRRVFKKTFRDDGEEGECYLYLGKDEIGSVSEDGELKWLRIPGMTTHPDLVRAIAIETKDAIYAPIYDVRWNIVKLVNIADGSVLETRPDPFGQNLAILEGCPWTFCSKRYDPEIGLVDFGARSYDPELREWTSLDPLMQDSNPYRYCFDNPLQFLDPDGRFGFAVPIVTWGAAVTSPIWGTGALAFAGGAAVGYLGYKGYQLYQDWNHRTQWEEPDYPFINRMEAHKEKEGKQKDGIPKSNGAQNSQFKGAVKEIERKLGKKLTDRQKEKLHDYVTKQGYGFHDIVEEGYWLFQ
jgi:RHS repeat-associated protein